MSDLNTAAHQFSEHTENLQRPPGRKNINHDSLRKILNTHSLDIIPRLVSAPKTTPEQQEAWRKKYWQFHLTGKDPDPQPAALEHIFSQNDTFLNYPFVTSKASPDSSRTSYHSLHTWLQGIFPVPPPKTEAPPIINLIRDNFWLFIKLTREAVSQGPRKIKIYQLFETVVPDFKKRMLEQGAPPDKIDVEMEKLRTQLPELGRIFGLGEHTLYHLAVSTALTKYFPRKKAFVDKTMRLISQLEEKLRANRYHSSRETSETLLREGLGSAGSHLVNSEKLAKMLAGPSGSITLPPQRIERIEKTLEILKSHIQKLQQRKSYLLFSSRALPDEMILSQGEIITDEDCFEAAGKRFEKISRDLVAVCRALRTAQLESEDAYVESEYDALMENLAWFSLSEEERSYLQPILVFENSQALNGSRFNSFANLLLNRYPVTTVISQSIIGKKPVVDAGELIRSQTDWGYLAMAYRVAYVLQSSLSQPSHLVSGLLQIGSVVRPAVAFVAVPSWDTPVELAQVQLKAAIESRITPLYRYNPEGGLSFPQRFQLSMNPQPQTQWPVHTIDCLDENDQIQEIVSEFTFAHFAATDPAYRANFQIIERAAWADNQISIYRYLNEIDNLQPNVIPYIQVIDERGEIQRAVITRHLAFACWQRILSWNNFQERAGINNMFVENARSQALSEGEMKLKEELGRIEERHRCELKVHAEKTVAVTVNRLVDLLLNPEKMNGKPSVALMLETLLPAEEAVQQTPPPEPLAAKPTAAESAPIEVPFIESELCSSCNDCINLNSVMFQYNDNKEAYIAQAEAGTYLQLVKAAEKCPSRCIHPGLPRKNDKTADEKLIARANTYN